MTVLSFGVNDVQYEDKSLGDIVFWNEFGTENMPPRPALQTGMEISIKRHRKLIQANTRNYLMALKMKDQKLAKKLIKQRKIIMFTQLGRSAKKEAQAIIREGTMVGNAPATIKKKGFDHPLYVVGDYLENVNYEVKDE